MTNDRLIKLTSTFLFAGVFATGPALGQIGDTEHGHPHDHGAVAAEQEIGTVDFQVPCDEGVREPFDRSLALMHHMMYEQARSGFEAVVDADPGCAMAHWGIATTLFQPLWPERPDQATLKRGWEHSRKAMDLEPASERERLLIEATAGFFREPEAAGYWDRIGRWAEGMRVAYQAYPDDLDIAALYGLSRIAVAPNAPDRDPLYDEAEEVLRAVWKEEQTHPGAIHYAIHATDVDGRAENALDMVEVYGTIAPEVPHALHMPSHIYVRLGEWPEVIDWNRRSADAALREPVNGAVSLHYIHAIDYMVYAYLQQGEDDKARAALDEAMARDKHQPSFASAFHAAAMPARLAVEQRKWEDAMALEPGEPEYLPWDETFWPEALTWYARGLGGVHGDDLDTAREAERRMIALRDQAEAEGEDAFARYIEVDRKILSGWIARRDGDGEEAVRLMRAAAALEGSLEKHPITPGALLPPNEALGDLFLDLGRPSEALEAYRESDEIWPGRFNTLLGAARAAEAAGDDSAAREHYQQLLEIAWASERTEIADARRFLAG
jgi:tetratricopeptide (TPR) repeat protein